MDLTPILGMNPFCGLAKSKGLIRERLAMTNFSSLFAEGILCLRDLMIQSDVTSNWHDLMIQSDVTSNWQAILSIPEYAAVLLTRVLFQFC